MKNSLIIVGFFILGISLGFYNFIPEIFIETDFSLYALYILMFLVGLSIGSDNKALEIIKKAKLKIILVPLSIIIGTLSGVAVISFFIEIIKQ